MSNVEHEEEFTEVAEKFPWRNGFWWSAGEASSLCHITNSTYKSTNLIYLDYPTVKPGDQGTLAKGDFGPASKELLDATGNERYNVQFQSKHFTCSGILNSTGTQIHVCGDEPGETDVLEWMNEERLKLLKEGREPADAPIPPSHITVNPDVCGRVLWFSGPPGSGKSTCAQLMGRQHGYIYYEGDCFCWEFANPFIDVNANDPETAASTQNSVKDVPSSIFNLNQKMAALSTQIDDEGNFEGVNEIMTEMAQPLSHHIKQQRQRLGGDWSVSWVCNTRKERDIVRGVLGECVVFIMLNVSRECQRKRLVRRHQHNPKVGATLIKMYDLHEPSCEGELNTFDVDISETMTPGDVMDRIMDVVLKL